MGGGFVSFCKLDSFELKAGKCDTLSGERDSRRNIVQVVTLMLEQVFKTITSPLCVCLVSPSTVQTDLLPSHHWSQM